MATNTGIPSADAGNQVVGKVVILYGTVKAVSPDGTVRLLVPNSPIFADDRIVTESDGNVSIMFDGPHPSQMDLGRMSSVAIDDDVYAGVMPSVASDAAAEAEQIQKLLLAGDQPVSIEAPAAGGDTGAGGAHPLFVVNVTGAEVMPTSGAETIGVTYGTTGTLEGVLPHINTITLTAGVFVDEGGAITYTATLDHPAQGNIDVTISTGDHIIIPNGATTGTVIFPVHPNDVYVDPGTVTTIINSATGGGGETLVINPTPVVTNVLDTIDTTTVSLSVAPGAITEAGATVTYTATLTNVAHGAVTVQLDNGQTITIADGHTTGTVDHTFANTNDVYIDPTTSSAAITSATGGNFENLVVDHTAATVAIADTIDTTTATITTANVTENDPGVTFNIHLSNPPQGAASVDVQVGETSHNVTVDASGNGSLFIATANPDVYIDPSSITATITAINGGNFEATSVAGATATAQIADTIDTTTVSLSVAPGAITEAGATVTYTATLTNAAHGAVTVQLDNGQTITIADGHTTGTIDHTFANTNDVYVDPTTSSAAITSATGGNFENLVVDHTAATVAIADTIDTTTVKLDNVTVTEGGGIVYTAHVDNAPQGDLQIILNDTAHTTITIQSGQLSGSSDTLVAPNVPDGGTQTTVGIESTSGGNYENLDTSGTLTLTINDTAPNAAPDTNTVVEGASLTVDAAHGLLVNDTPSLDLPSSVLAGTFVGTAGGTLVLYGDGSYHYTAPAHVDNPLVAGTNQPVPDIFTYTMQDADGSTSQSTLTIAITDTAPVAAPDTGTVVEGNVLSVSAAAGVLVNDSASADGMTVVAGTFTNGTAGGTLVLHSDGSYDYAAPTHVDNTSGAVSDVFTYTIQDADGSTSQSTLAIAITDTTPAVDFTNSIGPISAADQTYTGLWHETPSADTPNVLSLNLSGVTVDGSPTTLDSFTFDSTLNTGHGSFTYTGTSGPTAVGFDLTLNPDGTYDLLLGTAQEVVITPEEFQTAVVAAGPTSTYEITYVDTTTGTTETAYVSATAANVPLSLVGAASADGTLTTPYTATTVGTLIKASSDGIGVDNNVLNSTVTQSGLTAEGMTYNPVSPASAITVFFKGTGAAGFGQSGAQDVLYITLHEAGGSHTQTIMLDSNYGDFIVNGTHLTPITSGSYTGGPLLSYTLTTPTGWSGIDSADVVAGFYLDSHGNIQGTDVKLAFGFATSSTVTVDHEVQLNFTATITDSDGSHFTTDFLVQTDANHTFNGTSGADYIVGTTGADTIYGGDGADTIHGGGGADTIYGGAGNDHITFDSAAVLIGGGDGNDTLVVNSAATIDLSHTLNQNLGGGATVTGFENVDASKSSAAVTLTGDSSANVLSGGAGNDTLTGGGGTDTFMASAGHDHITDYNKVVDHDTVDISNLVANATKANLSVTDDGGKAQLHIYADTAHTSEVGSITFDNITSAAAPDLDHLLGTVDVKDGTHNIT